MGADGAGRGRISLGDLASLAREGRIETVLVVFPDLYGRLLGKRFEVAYFLDHVAGEGTHGCDYLLTVDMEMEPVAGYRFASWELGYGDVAMRPDLATLRVASWLDRTAVVLCDLAFEATGEPAAPSPRAVLARQAVAAESAGFRVEAASELEFYAFETSYRSAARRDWGRLVPAGWYLEDYHALAGTRLERLNAPLRRHLRDSGIDVEGTKGEWGLGQHEINVRHAEVREMADRHVLLKQCAKETAEQAGLSVTFMAKFAEDRAGSSCHVHLSLWRDGRNAFAGDGELGSVRCSDVFRWFLGGWIARAAETMPFYAPNPNSYKRYRAASWAPTRLAWSHDNRTVGFRVVGAGPSLRIECRIPGADCNPYLAFAAAIASGLDGIARRTEPPPAFAGDAYAAEGLPRVPATLGEATGRFASSAFARAAFGDDVVDHYARFFAFEQEASERAVTDWERRRYFERI
ncbi:MAG: glutamine synthetase family protein [Alphaproteobacteria bacterium]